MLKKEDKKNIEIIAIVGIVAIVAIIVLYLDSSNECASAGPQADNLQSPEQGSALVGRAMGAVDELPDEQEMGELLEGVSE